MRSLSLVTLFALVAVAPAQGPVKFNRDIRPILSDNCFSCHGPDSARRKAALRLDTDDGLFGARDEGPAVVKGNPAKSPLLTRIISNDPHDMMPPPKSNKKLTAVQKETMRRWIQEGAPFENHWSFVKPVRPAVPNVKNPAWVKTPIDAFILARLEAVGLTPAAEADRRSLIRRVTLDLIGLPPTPAEVDAFLADQTPNAYEKLVDRLLASEHYGEHRGRYWLDAARYGDTHGLHFDNYREMWPYRDWVIRAFNRNQPFDQFTVEQLAGDLLPGRTSEQLIASGFHRCNITTNEGGSINEEVLVSYARDRVETTATVWLGLTAGCSQCHNHKFDPLPQKEFYQFAAYFRNTLQGAMDGNIPNTPPTIIVPGMDDRARFEALQNRAEQLRATLDKRRLEGRKAFDAWRETGALGTLTDPLDARHEAGVLLVDRVKDQVRIRTTEQDNSGSAPKGSALMKGPGEDNGIIFTESGGITISGVKNFSAEQPLTISAWVFAPVMDGTFTLASKVGTDGADKDRGWRLTMKNRAVTFTLVGDNPKEGKIAFSSGNVKLEPNKWTHVVASYDGSKLSSGLSLFINGKKIETPPLKTTLVGSTSNAAPLILGGDFKGGGLTDVRVLHHAINHEEAAILANWLEIRRELPKEFAKIDPKVQQSLALLYFNRFDSLYQKSVAELHDVDDSLKTIMQRSPVTHVMQERPGAMPTARVLFRGQYDQPREEVKPGVFTSLHPLPAEAPANRLGLAQWIVSPENPLTARVTVNRFWQEVFGTGLVRSAEDFGGQGETPSHPELLDWLAVEFREGGWDIKKLFKMIVTSNAYKQAATTTAEKREKDPSNRLLSRGARYRMDGEMIRDQALAASDLLVRKIGGPSVKPYQPEGVWESVGILGASNTINYRRDAGEGLYRRGMYWFWKRMSPPASLEIFNAPSRESCTVRRERTNTPLQALVTMNDPQFVEASRHLAQLALLPKDQSTDTRLDAIALRLMARPFRDEERKIVKTSLAEFELFYKTNPKEAAKLIAVGDSPANPTLDAPTLAAWTMLSNQLLNLDEVLNK